MKKKRSNKQKKITIAEYFDKAMEEISGNSINRQLDEEYLWLIENNA